MKSRLPLTLWLAIGAVLAGIPGRVSASGVETKGTEFPLTGRSPGDQVHARLALGAAGGFLVWQDAAIDGKGLGIAAARLNETLSPQTGAGFRVNEEAAGNQENPRVVLLPNGGAFFAWEGGREGFPRIHGRVLGADGVFSTGDLVLTSGAGEHESGAELAVLANGEVIVVWSSYRQDGLNYDVYGRRFLADGSPASPEFRVNQGLGLGRRTPTVAGLLDGGFLVAWVGERIVGERDYRDGNGRRVSGAGAPKFEVAIYARAFEADGTPRTGDNRVAGMDAPAANPALVRLPDGRLLLAWTRRHPTSRAERYDVASAILRPDASGVENEQLVNTYTFGDQLRPCLAAAGSGVFVVWTSMGQDGSLEGVYGRWIGSDGVAQGDELRINSTVGGGQILPTVGATDAGDLLVAWSSNLPQTGLELFAQRLAASHALRPPSPPSVVGLSSSSVMISWPSVAGLELSGYRVYLNGTAQFTAVNEDFWVVDGLSAATEISAQVAYVLTGGEISPRSAPGTGRTWGVDLNSDGLPDDWQARWWPNAVRYPDAAEDSDGDGVTNLGEWLAGTDPTDATSSLKVRWRSLPLGLRIEWSTQPGLVYELQTSSDGKTWTTVGGARFAADTSDSLTLNATGRMALYRVLRVR